MIDNNFTEQNSSKKSVADSSISRRSKYAQSVRYSDNKVKDSNLDFNVNTLLYSNSHDMNIVKQDFRSLATTSWDFRPSNYAKILNQIGPVTPLSSTKTNSSTFESIGSTGSYKTYDESNKEDTSELSIDLILSSPMFKNSPLKTNSCEKFHSDHNTQDESTDDESLSFEDSRDVELTDLLSELKDSKLALDLSRKKFEHLISMIHENKTQEEVLSFLYNNCDRSGNDNYLDNKISECEQEYIFVEDRYLK